MKDVSGVQWAVPGAHVGLYGPLLGRVDQLAPTPDSFSPTPGVMPDVPADEIAPQEVPDAGSVSTQ